MRCVVAMFQHETNTFSPIATSLSAFGSGVGLVVPPTGDEAIAIYGNTDFAFAAMLQLAQAYADDVVVPIAAYAEPSGKVDNQAFESICDDICLAVRQGCDAVLLDLHGAMVTQSFDDAEGELLRRIRTIDPEVPIAVALDFHANVTATMVSHCTVIDGYRTYPHTDMFDTGKRTAETLFLVLKNSTKTRMSWHSIPLMTHMLRQSPDKEPMYSLMQQAISTVEQGQLLNASVFGGFPLADIPHVSLCAVVVEAVVEEQDAAQGAQLCERIVEQAWQKREEFNFVAEPLVESVARAKVCTKFPVVIADHGDNSGAGGSADDLTVLDEMLVQQLDGIVAGPIWDPQAVAALAAQGIGKKITIDIGGKTSVKTIHQIGKSLRASGTVTNITNGRFVIQGPMQTGLDVNLGTCVVFDIGAAQILITSERWEPCDPGCFSQAGIDHLQAKYLLIKSRQHFRATFEDFAAKIILAAGPGVCSSDYSQFNFINLGAGLYPIDRKVGMEQAKSLSVISDAS